MHSRMTGRRRAGALLAALALFSVALVTATSSGAAPSVRGFDGKYCSPKPSTSLWGFSSGGCIVPAKPSFISDIYGAMYKYVSQKTGKKHPTFIVFGTDNASGRNGNRIFAIAAKGAGFKVVG